MINIDELRRGNYILYKDTFENDIWLMVTSISLAGTIWLVTGTPINHCSPLPATKENIVRLGFNELGLYDNVYQKDDFRIHFSNNNTCLLQYQKGNNYFEKQINSIHQLQNIYFALTTKELTIRI